MMLSVVGWVRWRRSETLDFFQLIQSRIKSRNVSPVSLPKSPVFTPRENDFPLDTLGCHVTGCLDHVFEWQHCGYVREAKGIVQ